MRSMSKKVLFVVLVLGVSTTSGHAGVSKAALRDRVEEKVRMSLLQGAGERRDDKGTLVMATTRAQRIAKLVDYLEMDEINDALAGWIEESFVDLIANRAPILMRPGAHGEDLLRNLDRQAQERLKSLTDEKGKELWEKRAHMLRALSEFDRELRSYLAKNLISARMIQVEIDVRDAKSVILKIASALDRDGAPGISRPDSQLGGGGRAALDFRALPIDSRILVLALIREIAETLGRLESRERRFSFANIFSRVFDDGGPHARKMPTFQDIKPRLDDILGRCVTEENDVARVNLFVLRRLVSAARRLRVKERVAAPVSSGLPVVAVIEFRNAKDLWGTLVANSGEGDLGTDKGPLPSARKQRPAGQGSPRDPR